MKEIKEIKYRLYLDGKFTYWGFIDGGFMSPTRSNKEVLTMAQTMERSQLYLGVPDINNKDMYEGDIIKFKYRGVELTGVIKYGFANFYIDATIHYPLCDIDITEREIIGNVSEISELKQRYEKEKMSKEG